MPEWLASMPKPIPLQPFLVLPSKYYLKQKAKEQTIGHFYQLDLGKNNSSTPEASSLTIVPDATMDLVVKCDPQQPEIFLHGPVVSAKQIELATEVNYFGVRFMPQMLLNFSDVSVKQLKNGRLDLKEIIAHEQVDIFLKSLLKAKNFQARIEVFYKYLYPELCQLSKWTKTKLLLSDWLEMIDYYEAKIQLADLEKLTGYSSRYIYQLFKYNLGVSPKLYLQIYRFQKAIRMMSKENVVNDSYLACDLGFYDQSHFINQFKTYAGMTPNQYQRLLNSKNYRHKITIQKKEQAS